MNKVGAKWASCGNDGIDERTKKVDQIATASYANSAEGTRE